GAPHDARGRAHQAARLAGATARIVVRHHVGWRDAGHGAGDGEVGADVITRGDVVGHRVDARVVVDVAAGDRILVHAVADDLAVGRGPVAPVDGGRHRVGA